MKSARPLLWMAAVVLAAGAAAITVITTLSPPAEGLAEAAAQAGDYGKALGLWERQAQQGDIGALTQIGRLYESRPRSGPRPGPGADSYRTAAEQGNVQAQIQLGRLYEQGLGVEQSREGAARWYQQAAE